MHAGIKYKEYVTHIIFVLFLGIWCYGMRIKNEDWDLPQLNRFPQVKREANLNV